METGGSIPLEYPDCMFVDGKWVLPASEAKIDVINSTTEEVFVSVAEARAVDVERAVTAARRAFDNGPWPRLSHAERATFLRAIASEFRMRSDELARIWTIESGVIFSAARATVASLGDQFEYYAGLADTFPFQELHKPAAGVGILVREPVGVVAAIIPWNSPGSLIAVKCAPALLAGCTVVLKASPEAPGAAYIFAEICEKVGLPPGVVNVLMADRAASEALVRNPAVDKVTFTGSTAAGRRIASICGERIARYTLELGGKSAAVILDDYDLDIAATTLAGRTPFLTGQACALLSRVIVSRRRHDALVDALSARFAKIKVGDPFDPVTQMGPLATGRQRDRVEHYIAQGVAEGATLSAGGRRPSHLNRGFFIEPTIFADVDNRSTIAQEEIFGPVLTVIAADDEEDAVQIANDTVYGLNSAVFTNDVERAYAVARRLRAGSVGHKSTRADFSIAFGGFKQSGVGREGGIEGLLPYLEAKTVVLECLPASQRELVCAAN